MPPLTTIHLPAINHTPPTNGEPPSATKPCLYNLPNDPIIKIFDYLRLETTNVVDLCHRFRRFKMTAFPKLLGGLWENLFRQHFPESSHLYNYLAKTIALNPNTPFHRRSSAWQDLYTTQCKTPNRTLNGTLLTRRIDIAKVLAVLPNGNIVTGSDVDHIAHLFLPTGRPIGELSEHSKEISGVTALADGNIATASYDGTVRLWSPKGYPMKTLIALHKEISNVMALDNGNFVTTNACLNATIWSSTGKHLQDISLDHIYLQCMTTLQNGRFATGCSDGIARIWSSEGKCIAELRGHTKSIRRILTSKNGNIATLSTDNSVRTWTSTGEPIATYVPPPTFENNLIIDIIALKNGNIAALYSKGYLQILSPTGSAITVIQECPSASDFNAITELPNGLIAAGTSPNHYKEGTSDYNVVILLPTGEPIAMLRGHTNKIRKMVALPNGDLFTGDSNCTGHIWRLGIDALVRKTPQDAVLEKIDVKYKSMIDEQKRD